MEKEKCSPTDVSLKSFFLGPQAENADWVLEEVTNLFKRWFGWRKSLFPQDGEAISTANLNQSEFRARREISHKGIQELLTRFEKEIPKFSPRYIGHMFSEISLPALFGHIVSLIHNPNNISSESSKIGIQIEDEAIQYLAQMLGMSVSFGHFTSGGTIANFECLSRALERANKWLLMGLQARQRRSHTALTAFGIAHMGWEVFSQLAADAELTEAFQKDEMAWSNPLFRARKIDFVFGGEYQGPILLVPNHKHYSWTKGASLFGIGEEALWPIELNEQGTLNIFHLRESIEGAKRLQRPIVAVISVLGTTELGFVDPIQEVQELLDQYQKEEGLHIWHHVDAAYGGFFTSMKAMKTLKKDLKISFQALSRVHSITIDPHKMGYVPYSSGAFLCRYEKDYFVKSFTAPYVQFEIEKDKGPFTLEGSRSAAGAVATWLTARSIGFTESGYGSILERTIRAKIDLEENLGAQESIRIAPFTDLNILGFCVAAEGDDFEGANQKTLALFKAITEEASPQFFISKTKLLKKSYESYLRTFSKTWSARGEIEDLDMIRICTMNPFFGSKELKVDLKEEFSQYLSKAIRNLKKDGSASESSSWRGLQQTYADKVVEQSRSGAETFIKPD